MVKAPCAQKTKVRSTSNTHSHEYTRSSTHPTTHRRTNLPTHDVLQQYSRADALIETEFSCCDTGISMFYDSPPPRGASDPSPGGPFNTPRSPSWARHPLFAGDREGLPCEWDVAAQRGHGRPSENRETQVFFGCVITKMFSKIHLDIITTIEEHYITVGLSLIHI